MITTQHFVSSLLAVVATLGITAAAQAAPAPTPVTVGWSGEQPVSMVLDDAARQTSLALDAGKQVFSLAYQADPVAPYLTSGAVQAAYGDGSFLVLHVRLSPALPSVSARMYRIKPDFCWLPTLAATERMTGELEATQKAYFTARALYLLEGENRCSKTNRKRAAKAWFDRAYELTTLRPFFDLSPEAAAAYATYDPTYVRHYRDEVRGAGLKLVNDAKREAIASQQFGVATALNRSLLDAYKDPEVAALGGRLQGLTAAQLAADGARIEGRVADVLSPVGGPQALVLAPKTPGAPVSD